MCELEYCLRINKILQHVSFQIFKNGNFVELIPLLPQNYPKSSPQRICNIIFLNKLINGNIKWKPEYHFLLPDETKIIIETTFKSLKKNTNLPFLPNEIIFLILEFVVLATIQ